jgi:hypothetical protein
MQARTNAVSSWRTVCHDAIHTEGPGRTDGLPRTRCHVGACRVVALVHLDRQRRRSRAVQCIRCGGHRNGDLLQIAERVVILDRLILVRDVVVQVAREDGLAAVVGIDGGTE